MDSFHCSHAQNTHTMLLKRLAVYRDDCMDLSDRGSVIVVKCWGHVCYCLRGGRLCLAVRSEFSSVGVVLPVLVVMRGSALACLCVRTNAHTLFCSFSQVALRGNGCAELWPACLQAVLNTAPTPCRQVGALPEGSVKQHRIKGEAWVYDCCNQ